MKKTVPDGGGERKPSLRNRRRRGLDDDPRPQPSATVTSGALQTLQTTRSDGATAEGCGDRDDWLFAGWLDGGGGGGGGTGGSAPSTYTP